jgi:glycosyltransferase involved in cell wall biosynthesis
VFRELTGGLEAGVTLCAPADPTALAAAIGRALAAPDDPDAAAERRAEATRRFDIARMTRIYLRLYQCAG